MMSKSQRRITPAVAGRPPTKKVAVEDFAKRLRRLMAERQLSQADLARMTWGETKDSRGYAVARNRDRVSVYLKGDVIPDNRNLVALAKALEVAVEELAPLLTAEAVERDDPDLSINVAGGLTHLRVNLLVPIDVAMKVGGDLMPWTGAGKNAAQQPAAEPDRSAAAPPDAAGSGEPPAGRPDDPRSVTIPCKAEGVD